MEEKKMNNVELSDEEMGKIKGGYFIWSDSNSNNKGSTEYYIWRGKKGSQEDEDKRYLCPKCGRPVRYGKGYRYYCDSCNDSWFMEQSLDPNLASGLWERSYNPYVDF